MQNIVMHFINLSWAQRQAEQGWFFYHMEMQQSYMHRAMKKIYFGGGSESMLSCLAFSLLSFQQSLTLMLSPLPDTLKVLDPLTTRGYSLSHVCLWPWGGGGGCLSTSHQTETSRVNRLHWKPLSGLKGEIAISHLLLTVHSSRVCNQAIGIVF